MNAYTFVFFMQVSLLSCAGVFTRLAVYKSHN